MHKKKVFYQRETYIFDYTYFNFVAISVSSAKDSTSQRGVCRGLTLGSLSLMVLYALRGEFSVEILKVFIQPAKAFVHAERLVDQSLAKEMVYFDTSVVEP